MKRFFTSCLSLGFLATFSCTLLAASLAEADVRELMQNVSDRKEPVSQRAKVLFRLTDRNQRVQERKATVMTYQSTAQRRTAMYFHSPRAMRGSAFLSWNALDQNAEDGQWLYLPTLRRVRRVPSRERGKAFLGTDLSYDDIRHPSKVEVQDWRFTSASKLQREGLEIFEVEGVPINDDIAKELGYSKGVWQIDPERDFILQSRYWDQQGKALKTVSYSQIVLRDGILTADRILVKNSKTGHTTEVEFDNVEIGAKFEDKHLTQAGLSRGL